MLKSQTIYKGIYAVSTAHRAGYRGINNSISFILRSPLKFEWRDSNLSDHVGISFRLQKGISFLINRSPFMAYGVSNSYLPAGAIKGFPCSLYGFFMMF